MRTIALIFLCILPIFPREHPRLRRITWAASCLASGMDLETTLIGIRHGAREANPFLSTNGRPLWGQMIAMKSGFCAISGIAGELHWPFRHDRSFNDLVVEVVNLGTAGLYSGVSARNLWIVRSLRRQQASK